MSRKKQKDADKKLGLGYIYGFQKKNNVYDIPTSLAPEDKTWEEINGYDISKLLLQKWSVARIMEEFGVSRSDVIKKVRFSWSLPNIMPTFKHKRKSKKK